MLVFLKTVMIFMFGGVSYTMIELLFRGYTHESMTVLGGVCLLVLFLINEKAKDVDIFLKCFAGASVITLLELLTGYIVNCILKLEVWDYSLMPLQLDGQICLQFSLLWFFLCVPAFLICTCLQKMFNFIDKLTV